MKKFFTLCLAVASIAFTAQAQTAPAVTMEEVDIQQTTFDLKFTPNEATGNYYCCLFGVGELEAQYNMFGGWFGFQNYGDMIKAWGYANQGVQTKHWKDLNPSTTYEIWVLPCDLEDNYGELQCFEVTTLGQGGSGLAVIDIQIGEFGGDEENGYYQQVIYTPNEETAVFFDLICTQEFFDENGVQGVIDYLKAEDDPSDMYYDYYAQFGVDNAFWNAEYATIYHACAIGKNANGEWGEFTDVVFATPGAEVALSSIEAAENRSNLTYNLQGQTVREARGLVVRNGQKMLVK